MIYIMGFDSQIASLFMSLAGGIPPVQSLGANHPRLAAMAPSLTSPCGKDRHIPAGTLHEEEGFAI